MNESSILISRWYSHDDLNHIIHITSLHIINLNIWVKI